jgi:hypothetical protein
MLSALKNQNHSVDVLIWRGSFPQAQSANGPKSCSAVRDQISTMMMRAS